MAFGTRISEDGNRRVAENVAGFLGASSLNDTVAFSLQKETFTTDPALRGWLFGVNWAWSSGNGNMVAV